MSDYQRPSSFRVVQQRPYSLFLLLTLLCTIAGASSPLPRGEKLAPGLYVRESKGEGNNGNRRRCKRKRGELEGGIAPYLYPCMVPIKREPLTAFVSDTVAVLEHARGWEPRWKGALVVVIGHQVLYPRFRGWWLAPGWGKSTTGQRGWKRSNDTGYTACFTKIP